LQSGTMPPRLSTGYTAARNRQGFLIETHSYKDYKTRVDATYQLCRIVIQLINEKEYINLKKLNMIADEETKNCSKKIESFPLAFKNNNTKSIPFSFRTYKMIKEKSIISGIEKRSYEKTEEKYEIPYYCFPDTARAVKPPFGYIIPKQWSHLVEVLQLHGVEVKTFNENQTLNVTSYELNNPRWGSTPYEGRHTLSYSTESKEKEALIKRGAFFIPVNQQAAKVIMLLLEPLSNESFVAWGFMDAIFEQKESAEDYVMEKYALEMYNENPKLRNEFDQKIKTDTAFANSAQARLNYFFKNSPYYDNNIGSYPVLRVEKETKLNIKN
jgi:hypothetical protein